ncbi:putative alanine and valine rich protein [Mycobacteroides abscessus subsp. abscessus]|uniref:Alanine and valine rich protein n=1 Tax=Mycobacteroides abscessus subsp. abscessus TaxID=1185650 RepID=A0AB38D0N4_9MYCO|nr:SPFH domain-containing protein [Mycobacteroides abscessus]SHX05744.1 putative alanine and valine rich protein [Mycobacteroides abscessus subsp. abscessus]SIA12871.1 putative alanine and valine rich protein [Mycobacteroides abscessus subsp. abscessus]SIB13769.1 putative alanine and valine rich protein [Mycobacteroides abscessus subsp. abscessus]SIB15036.1 putative alanine and valine rich protein [Mycobacteroides abscessus subsp. abscessus]SIB19037.1 putative alanine and valine rich protein [
MPPTMWITLILLIIGAVALVATPILRKEDRPASLLVTGVAGVLALVFGIFASITTVGTRQIGIETTFGRPNGSTLSNGLHFKAPWANVTEMDGAIQIDQHKDTNRIKVRLGNSSTADADVSVRWQIKQEATPELFVQYKTFDNVRTNLVTRNLQVALNEVFATFDPLAPKNLDKSPLPELSDQARKILAEKVGTQVEILDVAVPTIDYDEGTEAKINQINQARAATSVALQDQQTALAQADANKKLADSVSHDPNVLVSKCLDIAKERGLALLCWPTPVMPTVPTK